MESIVEPTNRETIYVIAKLMNDCPFTLTGNSCLGNIPIENWVDVPRAIDKDGNQRTDLFVFALRNSSDKAYFCKEQILELIR